MFDNLQLNQLSNNKKDSVLALISKRHTMQDGTWQTILSFANPLALQALC